MQRFFDILFSALAILFLLPILLPIIIILKFTGEGEIFYMQERMGYGGEPFQLFKFATMLKDSLNIGTGSITIQGDSRVLPFGKFLRKTKINELPQLLNILRGDMSVIGPRPLVVSSFKNYPEYVKQEIYKVQPGLSGVGSIVFRDEEKILSQNIEDRIAFYNSKILPYKGELEVWYVKHRSLFLYFQLIILTVLVIVDKNSTYYRKVLKGLPEEPSFISA